MLRLRALALCFASLFTMLFGGRTLVRIEADTGQLGETLSNKVSNINVWDMGTAFYDPVPDKENNIYDFVEYVQLMQCSGGTLERDLFRDPANASVLDDYDFSRLVKNCEGILSLGAKPMLKLGSVPLKYSADPLLGGFGMNVRPPKDYKVYYDYIRALADALVQAFGREEVLRWRFGVMTEYENADWFYAGEKDAEASMESYCKLYDYTVQALIDAIGPDVCVGAHAMAVTEGLWDERAFIRHAAVGTNYATGETGSRLCYLSASFYDSAPGQFTRGLPLEETIAHLRGTAESYGLTDLFYGVDEGRIYGGAKGRDSRELASRTVGFTWQGAYDARMWRQTMRSGIDYFSSWGYLSGGTSGFPTISAHVARQVHKMAGDRLAKLTSTTAPLLKLCGVEVDGAASYDDESQTVHVLLYNFKNKLKYRLSADVTLALTLPQCAGRDVTVTAYRINDDCNYFDEWQQDRKTYAISDDCFAWSPDDPCLDNPTTLSDPDARKLYFEKLRSRYIDCARLTPETAAASVRPDGTLTLRETLPPSGVLFLEIR